MTASSNITVIKGPLIMSTSIETTQQENTLSQYKKKESHDMIGKPYTSPSIVRLELGCIEGGLTRVIEVTSGIMYS